MTTPATRITWDHPRNPAVKVEINEDGVHLRFCDVGSLEQPEVLELIELLTDALELRQSEEAIVPCPPSREELRRMSDNARAKWAANAVYRHLADEVAF
ncbi:MAG: hypothetical protein E7L06_08260 [Schaalia turicensis]|nr:hypothetical protein [Schaalia turicensis]